MKSNNLTLRAALLLFLSLAVLLLSSCGDNAAVKDSPSGDNPASGTESRTEPVSTPLSLISTAADITEIIDGLGRSGELVLCDIYSMGIGSVSDEVCTMDYLSPDIEAIAALEPDFVFVSSSSTDGTTDPYSALRGLGLEVIYIETARSIEDIKSNINTVAEAIGETEKASELNASIDQAVQDAKDRASGKEPVSVYFEISAAPWLYSFGQGTYLDEIITLCGGTNIYSDSDGWLSNTEESVLLANPSVIITNVSYEGYDYTEILSRPGWEVVDAVKSSRVYSVDTNSSSRGSQNIVKAINEISTILCGDAD